MNVEEKKQWSYRDGQSYQQEQQLENNITSSSTKEVIGSLEIIVWTILFLIKSFLLVFCKKQEFSNRELGTVTESSSEQRGAAAARPITVGSKSVLQPLPIPAEQQEETKNNDHDNIRIACNPDLPKNNNIVFVDSGFGSTETILDGQCVHTDNSDDEYDEEEEEDCIQEAIRRSLEDVPELQDASVNPQPLGTSIQTLDLCGVRVPCNNFVHKLSDRYQSEGLAPCKICFENEANAFFPQCRHGQICVPCAKTIVMSGNAVCHICRRPIVEVDFMFTS